MIDYRLLPYGGPVTLIRAEKGRAAQNTEIDSADLTSGFSSLCSKVDVAFVPGTHDDLMFSPNVERLAEVIRQSLRDLAPRETGTNVREHYVAV